MHNLDLTNPKGLGQLGNDDYHGEHGEPMTQIDIDRLCAHTSATHREITLKHHVYDLVELNTNGAKNTVILIAGGEQRVFCLDSTTYPDGFIMPANLIHLWAQHNINVILLCPRYKMSWAWQGILNDRKNTSIATFKYIKMAKNENVMSTLPKELQQLIRLKDDVECLLKSLPQDQKYWLVGHCASSDAIARYIDMPFLVKPAGAILWSPVVKNTWEQWLDHIYYFKQKVKVPVLFVQHQQDQCKGANPVVAAHLHKVTDADCKELVMLDGGENQGLPHFSMGYHGFRGIEDQLVAVSADFINKQQ